MADGQRRLGALLVEMGVIDEPQLERALDEQRRTGRRLGRVLVEMARVEESSLFDALAKQLGLGRWEPHTQPSQPAARALVSSTRARACRCLPLIRTQEHGRDTLVLATSDPLAPAAGKLVRTLSGRGVAARWLLASDSIVDRALVEAYGPEGEGASSPGVMVVKGRPERPPAETEDDAPRPESSSSRPESSSPRAFEALGSMRAVPALGIASSKVTGLTLLADDAVLEIVDEDPELPPLGYEAPSLDGGASSPASGRVIGAARNRPAWARAARTPRTNWGELVPGDEPPSVTSSPPDDGPAPVPLARLAIRRADGGIREVVPASVTPREPNLGFERGVASSPPNPGFERGLAPSPPNPASARGVASSPPEPASARGVAPSPHERPAPNLEATQVEMIEDNPPLGESGLQGEASTDDMFESVRASSSPTARAPGSAAAADDGSSRRPDDALSGLSLEAPSSRAPDAELRELPDDQFEIVEPSEDPTARTYGPSYSGPEPADGSTVSLFEDASEVDIGELFALGPVAASPSTVPLDVASDLAEPAPSSRSERPDGSAPPEERAREIRARLVDFSSGQPLGGLARDDVLRLVLAALLEQGAIDEALIRRVLLEG